MPPRMTSFHFFSGLPAEIRQRIWMLSMEPRVVVVEKGRFLRFLASRTPVLAQLHACSESRLHLQRYYTKCFSNPETTSQHTWVNFDIDTIRMAQSHFGKYPEEESLIQLLVVVGEDADLFHMKHARHLRQMVALRDVTIFDITHWEDNRIWWYNWDSVLQKLYLVDPPVHFYTRVQTISDHHVQEVNPDNIGKIERDDLKRRIAEDPREGPFSDYNEWDFAWPLR